MNHRLSFLSPRPSTAGLTLCLLAFTTGGLLSACTTSPDHGRPVSSSGAAKAERQMVKVITRREGNTTRFLLDNREFCEVTMTFEFATSNLTGNVEFPCTMTFPARRVTEAFFLEPEHPGEKWSYSYTNYYKLGNHLARHDDSVLYELPYALGSRYKVTQAFGGSYSHKGSNKYAIDWKMPEGTPVHAARGGQVVKIKDDSTTGGADMSFDRYNNFVLIRHEDGTLGHYCHLLKDSVVVRPGDYVSTGQVLARSGNTGFSSGPHLHFCVFITRSGKERVSVPIKFWAGGEATDLIAGRNYRASPLVEEKPDTIHAESTRTVVTAAGAGY